MSTDKHCVRSRLDVSLSLAVVLITIQVTIWFNSVSTQFRGKTSWENERIRVCDEAHFWLNGYVNKQNCRIWSEANPQVYVETPLLPEKLTVWCALWAGGISLQNR
ncbi:hypothetical protein TNCV_1249711 [Trichonephila clavipes]|nr:hypothetical protein TNCV_1249711 [Trichonephila clavipes]